MGLYLATITRESGNFQLLVTLITFPLTFLSGAYIPTMVLPKFLIPIVYINPLTYTTAAFRYVTLKMEGFSTIELVKSGVAFDIHGFIIAPWMSCLFIVAIGAIFLVLCVQQFSKADFSKVKTFKRGRH